MRHVEPLVRICLTLFVACASIGNARAQAPEEPAEPPGPVPQTEAQESEPPVEGAAEADIEPVETEDSGSDSPPTSGSSEGTRSEGVGPEAPAPVALPAPPAPAPQVHDPEIPPVHTPEADDFIDGLRVFLSVQVNMRVGELLEESGGGFSFEDSTLVGVPDALIGIRYDRLTLGLGMTWSQVSNSAPMRNPCTSEFEDFTTTQTLWGLVPTARYDVFLTDDGRGRMEAGIAVPFALSSRSRERVSGDCREGGRGETQEAVDGLYGFDAILGGRYHIWPALYVGAEVGLSYMVFDTDEDPDNPGTDPTIITLQVYSSLVVGIEVAP
ncbi:MAG: hypothetical protein AAGF12_12500 [Myxococcota bacterium]